MCFSPTFSFAASGILVVTSVFIGVKAHTPRLKALSLIPAVFAVQQAAEGVIWLLPESHLAVTFLAVIFLLGAFGFWPIAVPLFTYLIETRSERQKLLKPLIFLGFLIGIYLLAILIVNPFVVIKNLGNIDYEINIPFSPWVFDFYGLVTTGALLLSTHPWIRFIGIISAVTLVVAGALYRETFISVWCFLEAVVGIILCFHILHQKRLSLKNI